MIKLDFVQVKNVLLILQMKWSVISSPALLILYLVTFSSAEELKRKTPVQLKIQFTSILVCCIFEFPFFCTTLVFSTGILSHFYRHDLAYLSNVNVLYRSGFEADGCCCSCIHSFVFSGKGSEDRTCVFFVIYGNKRCFESFHNCTSHRRVKCETFKASRVTSYHRTQELLVGFLWLLS